MTTARTFKPLDIKRIKSVVSDVAKDNNVPSLAFPSAGEGATGLSEAAAAPELAVVTEKAEEKRQRPVRKTMPAPTKRVAVDLPEYLTRAVKKRALEEDVTIRFVYLTAFRAAGFAVNDADMMEDGRREG